VAHAGFAGVDAHVRKHDWMLRRRRTAVGQAAHEAPPLAGRRAELAEDGELCARVLAASGARHARVAPDRAASGAQKITRAGRQVFLRLGEVGQLRWSAAIGAVLRIAWPRACRSHPSVERFQHRTEGSAGEESVDYWLVLALDPSLNDVARILSLEPVHQVRAHPLRPGGNTHIEHAG